LKPAGATKILRDKLASFRDCPGFVAAFHEFRIAELTHHLVDINSQAVPARHISHSIYVISRGLSTPKLSSKHKKLFLLQQLYWPAKLVTFCRETANFGRVPQCGAP
jgi:hypothetical protein